MSANAEIIAELRRVLNERDEAREQLDLTKRELGRWVDRETKAVHERDSYQRQLDAIGDAIVTSITKRIEPRISRHPVTVVMSAGSLIAKIGEAIGCEFEDGDDLLEAVKELVRECDEARAACPDCAMWAERSARWHDDMQRAERERDEARAEVDHWKGAAKEHAEMQDEARAELATLANALDDIRHQRDRYHVELKQGRQEVERLRVELIRAGSRECDIAACNCGTWHHQNPRAAFRRGAEAMREACAQWIPYILHADCNPEEKMRAVPIPEEP